MTLDELMLIASMASATFLIRYGLLAASHRFQLSPQLLKTLNYVPTAVLMAIVVPAVFVDGDRLSLGLDNPRIIGAVATVAVGFWRKNLLLTISAGMVTFLLWKVLGFAG